MPTSVGSARLFRKVLEAVKLTSALIDEEHRGALAEVAAHLQGTAQVTRTVDVLASQADGWHGFHLYDRAVVAALETVLRSRGQAKGVEGRTVLFAGIDDTTKLLGQRIAKHGGILFVADRDRDRDRELAQELSCRQIQPEAIYTTLHDVLVVCGDAGDDLRSSYLKPGMTVMDLTAGFDGSTLLKEARTRGCGVVEARDVLPEHVQQQVKLIAGKEVPREPLQAVLDALWPRYEDE
jgi:shikimate 5-dehydrogenase